MLSFKNVSKTYISKKNKRSKKKCEVKALVKVSAKFKKNQFISILGPSGSGKTTLLNVLSGLDCFDDGGKIAVYELPTDKFNQKNWDNYRNYMVGYVFQDYNLIETLTALDNVALALAFSKIAPTKAFKLAKDSMKKVGIYDLRNKYISELSGGQKQLVAISRAIVKDPDIIFADEPTGALDSKTSIKIMDTLKKLSRNRLVVMATHNEKLARQYSTHIYNLKDGHLSDAKVIKDNIQNVSMSVASPMKKIDASTDKDAENSSTLILEKNKIRTQKSSLSIFTAFWIAFRNLKSKKVKSTLMICSAVIGVFIIAFILSLSNGLNLYIENAQNTILSQYPLYFSHNRDLSKVDSYAKAQQEAEKAANEESKTKSQRHAMTIKQAQEENKIALENMLGYMLSTNGESTTQNNASTINNLAAFKKYLDTNPDNFNDKVSSVEYTWRTSPVIYTNTSNGIEEVYPASGMFGSLGSGSGADSASGNNNKAGISSNGNLTSMFMHYGSLPENKELYEDDDCLIAGHWPQNPYQAILVLNDDCTIEDTLLYELGIRDFNSEIAPLIEKYKNKEKVDYPGQDSIYLYDDFLSKKLKVINPCDCYVKDQASGNFVDVSADKDFMKNVVDNAKDLEIVGIVLPKEGSKTSVYVHKGVQFPFDLNKLCIEQTKNSEVVRAQLENPEVDVLTGETFAYLAKADNIFERKPLGNAVKFNFQTLLDSVKINPDALNYSSPKANAKQIDISDKEKEEILLKLLQDKDFQEFIYDLTKEGNFEEGVYKIMCNAAVKYLEYVKEAKAQGIEPLTAELWFEYPNEGYTYVYEACQKIPQDMMADAISFIKKHGPKIVNTLMLYLEHEISNALKTLIEVLLDDSGPGLIEFDVNKFSNAMKINITMDDINQMVHVITGATKHTYKGNLADFGYDDQTEPMTLTIYPKDVESKAQIITITENYNQQMSKVDQENNVVTYTDDSGSMIGVALGIVAAISSLLIFFVSSALISGAILIGVVFGVSTLQRRREIGIIRALGARKLDILKMFNCETVLLGLISGIIGILLAAFVGFLINSAGNLGFDVSVLPVAGSIGLILGCALITFIAGFIPAKVASKKDPVKAIKGL